MIRKIFTLIVDNVFTEYHIDFEEDRKQFNLQPAPNNKLAPSFRIIERYGELIEIEEVDPYLIEQAKEKIRKILNAPDGDRF